MTTDTDAVLRTIEKALSEDGVYVAPSLREEIPAGTERQIENAVAGSEVPIFVVAVPVPYDSEFGGRPENLLAYIRDDTGADGVYLAADVTGSSPETFVSSGFQEYGVSAGTSGAMLVATRREEDDAGQQLLVAARLVANGTATEKANELLEREAAGSSSPSSSPGDSDDSVDWTVLWAGAGILVATAVVTAVVARLVANRRHPRRALGQVTDRPFALPRSVLATVRDTRDRQLEKRARSDVLALGEHIDGSELAPDADTGAWQAALDHYDLASRILDRSRARADVVGAVVLAGRGEEALADAVAGRPFEPSLPCYLNPLHGTDTRSTRWSGEQGDVSVPMCRRCASAARAHREPEDVLDLDADGEPRHYFELDVEPWSSTGYGALDPDLPGRLFKSRDGG
ncbi:MAG: hypothetical protein WKF83_13570 [Nocardioidaceae bacterium]